MELTDEQKIEIAYRNIRQSVLSWVSEAENYWTNEKQLNGAGRIKRSEVLAKIYAQYPILNKVANRYEVTQKLDKLIDDALYEMKTILLRNDEFNDTNESEGGSDETTESISNKE